MEEFGGEFGVGFGAARAGVVEGDGFAVTGGLGEADVAGNGGFEEFFLEEVAEVGGDLLGEVGAVVGHGDEDAFEGEAGVEAAGNAIEGSDELGDTFEGEVFGLEGYEQSVGGDEGVEGEEVEGRGAVKQEEGIGGADGREGIAQAVFAPVLTDELEVSADEIFAAWNEREVFDGGGADGGLDGGGAGEEVVDAGAGFIACEAEAGGGVGLGIAIDEQGGDTVQSECGGEVDGGGGFADATFLVDDGEDAGLISRRPRRIFGWDVRWSRLCRVAGEAGVEQA